MKKITCSVLSVFASGILTVLLVGCATKQATEASQNLQYVKSARDKPASSPAMFVRNLNSPAGTAVQGQQQYIDIFVNGMYLASLFPGAKVPVALCVGENRLRFVGRMSDDTAQILDERVISTQAESWHMLNLRGEEPTQFSVQQVVISAAQYGALFESNTALHSVSRVVNRCAPAAPAPVVAAAPAIPTVVPVPAPVRRLRPLSSANPKS